MDLPSASAPEIAGRAAASARSSSLPEKTKPKSAAAAASRSKSIDRNVLPASKKTVSSSVQGTAPGLVMAA